METIVLYVKSGSAGVKEEIVLYPHATGSEKVLVFFKQTRSNWSAFVIGATKILCRQMLGMEYIASASEVLEEERFPCVHVMPERWISSIVYRGLRQLARVLIQEK